MRLQLICICLILYTTVLSQSSKFNFGGQLKSGFIISHSGAVQALQNGIFNIYEINCDFPNLGSKAFKHYYPNHTWGISIAVSNYNNEVLLGNIFSVTPYLKCDLFQSKYWNLTSRFATGIAYVEKPFDRVTNFKNLVIGSYLNNQTDLSLSADFKIYKFIRFQLGMGLQHNSNGAIRRPNLGLNIPYLSFGAQYKIAQKSTQTISDVPSDTSRYQIYTLGAFGSRRLFAGNDDWYNIYHIAIGASRNLLKNRYLHLQIDLFFDQGIPHLKTYDFEIKTKNQFMFGPFLFYEKRFGFIGLQVGSGYYLYSIYPTFNQDWSFANKGGRFYNRAGLKFYKKNWFGLLNIKAHMGEADNIEFGIGKKW